MTETSAAEAAARCPSGCDPDCDADCHETHQVPHKRKHQAERCPGREPISDERVQEVFNLADEVIKAPSRFTKDFVVMELGQAVAELTGATERARADLRALLDERERRPEAEHSVREPAAFFEAGRVYANAAPFSAPVHQPIVHRFRCVAIVSHPTTAALHAIGWTEITPGVWTVGAIPAEYYRPELWSEIR